jgi:hypothetical protein
MTNRRGDRQRPGRRCLDAVACGKTIPDGDHRNGADLHGAAADLGSARLNKPARILS